ncbi:hypothetical protein OIU77_030427 [Salix suchowensis]|uniref:Uncharacterized protein n=1 Tax=Salix suchowensis TaxID=1278906 RepID=A0ABQ9BDW3_9ROSI|nr:hypothetical protein OIU77_030427 [Salix suchowensis]
MVFYEQDSGVIQWGLRLLDGDPPFYSGYYGDAIVQSDDGYHGHYARDHYDITDCSHVENDEMIARTLQEEFSQLAVTEENEYSHGGEGGEVQLLSSVDEHDWHCTPTKNYCSGLWLRLSFCFVSFFVGGNFLCWFHLMFLMHRQ